MKIGIIMIVYWKGAKECWLIIEFVWPVASHGQCTIRKEMILLAVYV